LLETPLAIVPDVRPATPPSPLFSPGSTQTALSLSSRTPRKDKLRQTVKQLRNEIYQLRKMNQTLQEELHKSKQDAINNISLEQYMSLTYKFCPTQELANFINTQISQVQKKAKGRRYSLEFKNECLAMYFTGPKLYKKKLRVQFCLPSPTTLMKLVNNLKAGPGLNSPELFKMLQMKTDNFSDDDKYCTLCLDEMSIKANLFYARQSDTIVGLEDDGMGQKVFKPATTATVFMIRGLKNKWSQPLSYHFFHGTCPAKTLKLIMCELIIKLKEIGLIVSVVISDMGSNNIQLTKLLNITPGQPYFFVNEQKIIYMFDTPHLIKTVRNNLKKHNFVDQTGQTISWNHIENFYKHDKNYPVRAAPKLTNSHIFPNNFEKMKVKFASQVFSQSVWGDTCQCRYHNYKW
jgi:hypothetical protein